MHQRAVLAGGCFWGMQRSPFASGRASSRPVWVTRAAIFPTPPIVITARMPRGSRIVFDPTVTSYRHILGIFFQIHDPTTLNRRAMIVGSTGRASIMSTRSRSASPRIRSPMWMPGLWDGKVVTEVQPVGEFWEAEPITRIIWRSGQASYTCHFRPSRLGSFQRHEVGDREPIGRGCSGIGSLPLVPRRSGSQSIAPTTAFNATRSSNPA